MSQVEISEAQLDLLSLVERARAGEEVLLATSGLVVARLVAAPSSHDQSKPRSLGRLDGKFKLPDDFDAPLSDDLLDLFYYGPIFPDDPPVEEAKRLAIERALSAYGSHVLTAE